MSNICVYGSSSDIIDKEFLDQAYVLGQTIAKAGYGMVFGGGSMGVMGAAARGVKSENGTLTGVLPRFMNVDGIPFRECDRLILTETMRQRKRIMEEESDAYIAAPGGIGTLEEFFEIVTLKQLRQHKKPIVLLNCAGYYDNLQSMMEVCVVSRFANEQTLDLYKVADNPLDALAYIISYSHADIGEKWLRRDEE